MKVTKPPALRLSGRFPYFDKLLKIQYLATNYVILLVQSISPLKHPLRILIFLLALPGYLYSQTLSELCVVEKSAKFLPEELIEKSVVDANGDVCAGLMIVTDLDGLTFSSYNGVVKVNTMPGKYTLFLQSNEQVVEVYKSGFASLKIILSEHNIKLVRGQTWQLTVTGEKKNDLIPITIKTKPDSATIWIDGKNFGSKPIPRVSQGKHILKIEKIGFHPATQSIDVSLTNVYFEMMLKELEMIFVESGTFIMGSPEGEGDSDEHPRHTVIVSDYYIDKYEVTQEEYEKVMGTNPSNVKCPTCPVENVNWNDAVAYATKEGKRLPTEAEWEYAARGGNLSNGYKYSGSDSIDEVGWYKGTKDGLHPVREKHPNELGIYDMTGNILEWCADWYDESYYANSVTQDPPGPDNGQYRVLRGGSWVNLPDLCRVAVRYKGTPDLHNNDIGFRCAKTP